MGKPKNGWKSGSPTGMKGSKDFSRPELTENEDTAIMPKKAAPTSSWWLQPSREAFVKARQEREKVAGWSRDGRNHAS